MKFKTRRKRFCKKIKRIQGISARKGKRINKGVIDVLGYESLR